MHKIKDQELIKRINSNDENAFKMLYDLYWEKLFVSGTNLLTWTDFPGPDPEQTSGFLSGLGYPNTKSFTMGVNLNF